MKKRFLWTRRLTLPDTSHDSGSFGFLTGLKGEPAVVLGCVLKQWVSTNTNYYDHRTQFTSTKHFGEGKLEDEGIVFGVNMNITYAQLVTNMGFCSI